MFVKEKFILGKTSIKVVKRKLVKDFCSRFDTMFTFMTPSPPFWCVQPLLNIFRVVSTDISGHMLSHGEKSLFIIIYKYVGLTETWGRVSFRIRLAIFSLKDSNLSKGGGASSLLLCI